MNLLDLLNREKENNREDENKTVIDRMREALEYADAIVIGAGAGLSTSAGLTYSGKRFEDHFSDFIEKYGMEDMYSAGFYPFDTQEGKWAYWSRHIFYNRYDIGATKVYQDLYHLVKDKNFFVLTTNVDHQFWISGFPNEQVLQPRGIMACFNVHGHAIKSYITMNRK